MPHPSTVLANLRRLDDTAPRITWYDLAPGPTRGERVELSAKVLANWVAKAGNALVEEWDVEPGSRVVLDLPPHWRSLYWAFAAWSVGAYVGTTPTGGAAVVLTTDPTADTGGDPAGLVTLAALARSATVPVPAGWWDEAKELATFPDRLVDDGEPTADDPLLDSAEPGHDSGVRLLLTTDDLGDFLRRALAAYASRGSVVLVRGGDANRLAAIRADERVSAG